MASFHDRDQTPDRHRHTHAFFQPPPSSASASSSGYLSSTTHTKRHRVSTIAQNRPNHDLSYLTPRIVSDSALMDASLDNFPSPAPLANDHYYLSGGFDTPTLAAATKSHYQNDNLALQNYRAGKPQTQDASYMSDISDSVNEPLATERNGMGRTVKTYSSPAPGWGRLALGLLGTVAGSVFDLCRNSVFRGFRAGGGQGYTEDYFRIGNIPTAPRHYRCSSPLPGRYPEDESSLFLGDFEQDNDNTTLLRPAKRRQTAHGGGWVVVERDLDMRDDSPHRLSTRRTSAALVSAVDSPPSAASRATGRRSLIPVSRRLSSQTTGAATPPIRSPKLTSTPTTRHRTSLAPIRPPTHRSRRSSPRPSSLADRAINARDSLSPEAHRYIKRQGKRDRDADRSMYNMSRQVQQLIKQGQAALGTRISLEGNENVEGWDSEDEGIDDVDFVNIDDHNYAKPRD